MCPIVDLLSPMTLQTRTPQSVLSDEDCHVPKPRRMLQRSEVWVGELVHLGFRTKHIPNKPKHNAKGSSIKIACGYKRCKKGTDCKNSTHSLTAKAVDRSVCRAMRLPIQTVPVVSIVVPFFGLTKYIIRIL